MNTTALIRRSSFMAASCFLLGNAGLAIAGGESSVGASIVEKSAKAANYDVPVLQVTAPGSIASRYVATAAEFAPPPPIGGLVGNIVAALDPADGNGPTTTDACSALTNAAQVAGKIALIDRGTCNFSYKVGRAQDAGATGVIIADDGSYGLPGMVGVAISIPTYLVEQATGAAIRTALSSGTVAGVLTTTTAIPANCSSSRWSSVVGSPYLATPLSAPAVARVSDPCSMAVNSAGEYVVDLTPSEDALYFARFYLLSNSFSGAEAEVFQAVGGAGVLFRVSFNGSVLRVRSGAGAQVGADIAITSGLWNSIELAWQASGSGKLDYLIRHVDMTLNQGNGAAVPSDTGSRTLTAGNVDEVRLGFIQQQGAGTPAGSYVVDAFASSRTSAPGRACRCDANGDGGISSPDVVVTRNESLGKALGRGQPDCNEDGGVSGPDIVVVRNLSLIGGACPP